MSSNPYKSNSPIQHYLAQLHRQYSTLREGNVADYIPELSHADPDWFGIALVTVDGHVYQVGDSHQDFTIQSISKVIAYGLALQDLGTNAVLNKVGVEPSGDSFNSISLDSETGQPCNPMINAGAIATSGLIKDKDGRPRLQRMLDTMERYLGHTTSINDLVYHSESRTGHRNRAIAHLLRNFQILDEDPDAVLELYFKQCSTNVNCRDLAVIAASLANNGINPITGVIALEAHYVDKVLSVMGSYGMYDYSGNWLYQVDMPAKSGVGGGIMAVLPGQFGLAVFSPPLDELGNSVRGIRVCKDISTRFKLHLYHTARATSASVLRVKYNAAQIGSRKSRTKVQRNTLQKFGHNIIAYELQGDLLFGSADSIVRELINDSQVCDYFIIDLKRVVDMHQASHHIFTSTVQLLHAKNKHIFFTSTHDKYAFVRYLKKRYDHKSSVEIFRFDDCDHALEWCEDQLLKLPAPQGYHQLASDLADQAICNGLSRQEINQFHLVSTPCHHKAGETIFKRGDSADSMYFITQGEMEVVLKIDHTREKRLTTLSAGMSFGELAMLNQQQRTAEVRAITHASCLELKFEDINELTRNKMLINIAALLASKLDRDTTEITMMD